MHPVTESSAFALAPRDTLVALDRQFVAALQRDDADLHATLMRARAEPDAIYKHDEAALIIGLAPHLVTQLATLFGIEREIAAIAAKTAARDPVRTVKRNFVQRSAVKQYPHPAESVGPRSSR
jgi:hypothetical protein